MEQEKPLQHHFKFTSTKPHVNISSKSLSSATSGGGLTPNMLSISSNDDNVRERLKRHHSEIAGNVVIPDKWSQEEMLKDWLDFGSFDSLLAPKGFDLARAALVAESRQQANKEVIKRSNSKGYIGMYCSATTSCS